MLEGRAWRGIVVGRAVSIGVVLVSVVLASEVLLAVPGRAQVTPSQAAPSPSAAAPSAPAPHPAAGFVSPYEIAKIARSAGFDLLAPPLRDGTTYVLRATDFRGILMRVVIDARSGAIRDATRIVPGPGRYGQYFGVPSPYDSADLGAPIVVPSEADLEPPPLHAPGGAPAMHPGLTELPPLPRPRPAALIQSLSSAVSPTVAAPAATTARKSAPAAVEPPLND
jgi:hypothetical protein